MRGFGRRGSGPGTSPFAEPAARLRLTAAAQAEAEHKRDELGPLTEAEATALVDALVGIATSDEAPTSAVHPHMIEIYCRQIAARGPTPPEIRRTGRWSRRR